MQSFNAGLGIIISRLSDTCFWISELKGQSLDKQHYVAVVISPHLDDAVFSCGGMIAKWTSTGRVLVINVFTHFPAFSGKTVAALSESRHQEELAAASLLDYEILNLGETDAFLRRSEYRSPARLFGDPVPEDLAYLPELTRKLDIALSAISFDAVYAPLGIGWHVDHTLCHLAARSWIERTTVFFYEDAPYCLWPATTRYRIAELGGGPDRSWQIPNDGTVTPRGFLSEWISLCRCWDGLPPMRNFKPTVARPFAVATVSLFIGILLFRHRHRHEPLCWSLSPIVNDISTELTRKLEACYLYASQVREFFVSANDCKARYLAYSHLIQSNTKSSGSDGIALERIWRVRHE